MPGPSDWTRTIISGTFNWSRLTTGRLSEPPLDGGGFAGYNSYSASSGSQARLVTHRFNIGPTPQKVQLAFWLYHTTTYSTYYDSLYVEVSRDGINYETKGGFQRYRATAGWTRYSVDMGDYVGNTNLYIGFRAVSKLGDWIYIDSVMVTLAEPTSPVNDVGVDRIYGIPMQAFTGTNYPITVRIRNYGLGVQTSIPVYYDPGDGSGVVTETWSGYLAPLDTVLYTFTTQYTPTTVGGPYTFKAWTALSTDVNNANDTASVSFRVCPLAHVPPYYKDFNEAWTNSTNPPFCGWTIIDGGSETPQIVNTNDWHRFEVSGRGGVARVYYSPVEDHNDWLISPRFDCSAPGSYVLSFWHEYNDFTTARLDTGKVLISLDGGQTWPYEVARFSNADFSGTMTYDISSIVSGQNNVKVAFQYCARDEYWWYIDDFKLEPLIDASVTSITRPQATEQKRVTFVPEVTVTNNSNYQYTFPVKAEIWTLPVGLFEGFESTTFPPTGWVVYNNDGGTQQWVRSTTSPRTGLACASSRYESSTLRNDDWLVTCPVVVPAGANLSFWYRTSVVENDSMEVWLSTTGNTIPDFTVMLDAFGIRTTTWTQKTISLAPYAGQTVWIAFVNKGLYQWTISIDDVDIGYIPPTLLWSDYTKQATVAGGGGTANVVFDPAQINTEGTYQFKAWTELAGDQVPANDLMSRTFTVEILPLTLVAPAHGFRTNDQSVTFEWNAVSGATTYRIEIANDPNFDPLYHYATVSTNTYTLDNIPEGTYYWRVRVEAPGTPDPWSESRMFTIDLTPPAVPTLVSPANNTLTSPYPVFEWEAISDAVLYNLVVRTEENEIINIYTEENIYEHHEALPTNTYYWKVRAKDEVGNWSNFSEEWTFSVDVTPPEVPTLISPADGTILNHPYPAFEWSQVTDAVLYNLVVRTETGAVIDTNLTTNTYE
ncbi:MAG: choice-of-anchor J domain-containing protein, partial [candidate division WOR-3 bacterium]|nr:choice-of-anchor J domain-containing protein [candidate division WOR-3 bacterium]